MSSTPTRVSRSFISGDGSATPPPELSRSLLEEELASQAPDAEYVEEITFSDALGTGEAARQRALRVQDLIALRDSMRNMLDQQWPCDPAVDARFDEITVTDQIDGLLPPALVDNEDVKALEAEREAQGIQDYHKLKSMLAQLKSGAVVGYEDAQAMVEVMITTTEAALSRFTNTRNRDAAELYLAVLDSLITKICQLLDIEIPDIQPLHVQVENADTECGTFEVARDTQDWTVEMTHSEARIYGNVASLIEATAGQLGECQRIHQLLHEYKVIPMTLDDSGNELSMMMVQEALEALRLAQDYEERHYMQMTRALGQQLGKFQASLGRNSERVNKLTVRIQNLLEDLAAAYEDEWRDEKSVRVCERTMQLLDKKQRNNIALTEGEEEELERLLNDLKAASQNTLAAEEMNQEVSAQLRTIAKERETHLVEDMYTLSSDHLTLIRRKYCQVSSAIFAAESAIEILHQEQEGLATKKARSNAAKNAQLVAQCTQEQINLDNKLAAEEQRKAALQEELAALKADWDDTYDHLESIDLPDHLRATLPTIAASWNAVLSELQRLEEKQLASVDLANRLDATFLGGV